ncbi:hypothetical protein [Pseudomonas sp. SST3]|nr:hypothetical protein [Pseudomonas sp. SST3]
MNQKRDAELADCADSLVGNLLYLPAGVRTVIAEWVGEAVNVV